jgi:hypothetical protein
MDQQDRRQARLLLGRIQPTHPEHRMFLSRAIVTVASILCAVSPAFAAETRLPVCSQSMMVGTWQSVFFSGIACPITIAANGSITAGTCETGSATAILHPPAGSLTIDRSCHVTGSITHTICGSGYDNNKNVYFPDCVNNPSYQAKLSLWRSGDGTRLSGSALIACTVASPDCNIGGSLIFPMEFIDGQ